MEIITNPLQQIPLPVQIIALTQALKMAGVPSQFLPICAMVWGAFLWCAEIDFSVKGVIAGLLMGLVTTTTVAAVDSRLQKINPSS